MLHWFNTSGLIRHPWESKLSVAGSWVDKEGRDVGQVLQLEASLV